MCLVYRRFVWLIETYLKYCRKERSISPKNNAPKEIRTISMAELTLSVVARAPVPVRTVPRIPSSRQPAVFPVQYLSPGGEKRQPAPASSRINPARASAIITAVMIFGRYVI